MILITCANYLVPWRAGFLWLFYLNSLPENSLLSLLVLFQVTCPAGRRQCESSWPTRCTRTTPSQCPRPPAMHRTLRRARTRSSHVSVYVNPPCSAYSPSPQPTQRPEPLVWTICLGPTPREVSRVVCVKCRQRSVVFSRTLPLYIICHSSCTSWFPSIFEVKA